MLTAFNYYEPEEEHRIQKGMKENPVFEQELKVAESFTKIHAKKSIGRTSCVVCGSNRLTKFFEKWGVEYLRCADCSSIVADVQEDDLSAYVHLKEMREIRLSDENQRIGSENRQQRWEELLDWLRYRTFRYCGRNTGFSILDYGNQWKGLSRILQESTLCKEYELRDSILADRGQKENDLAEPVDIVLALDYIQQKVNPVQFFEEVHNSLKKDGLFILGVKVGSGFDILTLRGNNKNIFPYEHVLMPSREGISIMLKQTGFELLEFTTPGTFDLNYVKANIDGLAKDDYFMQYFLKTATPSAEADFQRFIQKSGLSSYAQVIARRMG